MQEGGCTCPPGRWALDGPTDPRRATTCEQRSGTAYEQAKEPAVDDDAVKAPHDTVPTAGWVIVIVGTSSPLAPLKVALVHLSASDAERLIAVAAPRCTFTPDWAAPAGSGFNVTTQVQKPGAQPITAVWSVAQVGGAFKVTNLTVANINLAVTQSQDFDAIIQRKGFDALIAMMKARG